MEKHMMGASAFLRPCVLISEAGRLSFYGDVQPEAGAANRKSNS